MLIIVIQFMFLGRNTLWVLFDPFDLIDPILKGWAKMNLSRAQNILMPAQINMVV